MTGPRIGVVPLGLLPLIIGVAGRKALSCATSWNTPNVDVHETVSLGVVRTDGVDAEAEVRGIQGLEWVGHKVFANGDVGRHASSREQGSWGLSQRIIGG